MRHLLLFLFSLLPTFLWADNISVEKAQELAITFFKEGHPQRSAFSSLRLLVTDEAVSARAVGERLLPIMCLAVPTARASSLWRAMMR